MAQMRVFTVLPVSSRGAKAFTIFDSIDRIENFLVIYEKDFAYQYNQPIINIPIFR